VQTIAERHDRGVEAEQACVHVAQREAEGQPFLTRCGVGGGAHLHGDLTVRNGSVETVARTAEELFTVA
jgi:hypothetical protein